LANARVVLTGRSLGDAERGAADINARVKRDAALGLATDLADRARS
jgi:hypothetical protein